MNEAMFLAQSLEGMKRARPIGMRKAKVVLAQYIANAVLEPTTVYIGSRTTARLRRSKAAATVVEVLAISCLSRQIGPARGGGRAYRILPEIAAAIDNGGRPIDHSPYLSQMRGDGQRACRATSDMRCANDGAVNLAPDAGAWPFT
ncbi:hypothetical protein [Bradyrhizobium ottawaense]|uniref:hypothetical protein n=1 Tax=Bradyrhizobium ottawaense TaxID=931866 RepID=UPI0011784051|nr:hypothetical protein [Bradyrhizobium ottawaense]